VRSFQPHGRDDSGVEGFFPEFDTHAPLIARFQSGESELGARRNQIVADGSLVAEKFIVDQNANRVTAEIIGSGVTLSIAIKAGERIRAAGLQDTA